MSDCHVLDPSPFNNCCMQCLEALVSVDQHTEGLSAALFCETIDEHICRHSCSMLTCRQLWSTDTSASRPEIVGRASWKTCLCAWQSSHHWAWQSSHHWSFCFSLQQLLQRCDACQAPMGTSLAISVPMVLQQIPSRSAAVSTHNQRCKPRCSSAWTLPPFCP